VSRTRALSQSALACTEKRDSSKKRKWNFIYSTSLQYWLIALNISVRVDSKDSTWRENPKKNVDSNKSISTAHVTPQQYVYISPFTFLAVGTKNL